MSASAFEVTAFTKEGGALTKRIWLGRDGSSQSDGSECVMSRGRARRRRLGGMGELAELIGGQRPNEAIVLGALRSDLPDEVEVVTKSRLNGRAGVIARTQDFIGFVPGAAAVTLVDFDKKGMPGDVEARLAALGGLWPALVSIVPELANAARVMRASTSAGLTRSDTGEAIAGSGGVHTYLLVKDGEDGERFLKTLHDRCWLAGLGWMMVGAGGQLLERSVVDRVVGGPERLVFEGAPVVDPPLAQDPRKRRPIAVEGEALDTVAACPPLSTVEKARLAERRAKEGHRLAPESAKARETFVEEQSRKLAKSAGIDLPRARRTLERQTAGILLPPLVLPFDDKELDGKTVGDVLADPAKYEGETLSDPLEGVVYGRCKARIMRRADGVPWINSFAHGRSVYELKHDYRSAKSALENATKDEAADSFVRLALAGDLAGDEIEELRNLAHLRSGITKRALDHKHRIARQAAIARQAEQERTRLAAERRDPRPQVPCPPDRAAWAPQMQVINEVFAGSRAEVPPMRDFEGFVTRCRARRVAGLHRLTSHEANDEGDDETRLPPPEQLLLTRIGEPELAELIEQHIEYVDNQGREVHLPPQFVKHYRERPEDLALPIVAGIAQLPIVLGSGEIMSGRGLDRATGVVFRVSAELDALLPSRTDCNGPAVGRAMRWLVDEWLCDVATSYQGKCITLACALTLIERVVLAERPAFFFTAGRRGGGKTTTLNMIANAVLGEDAAAAAWSPNEEERRKALFAYFLEGVAFLVWDNITRGTTISCPSIEKSLTASFYSDRLLGVSEHKRVPVTSIQAFTGNAIAPRGDMCSRALQVLINVNRHDPENRDFKHPNPIEWTRSHRGEILQKLYTILLGNSRLGQAKTERTPAPTRFKQWWLLVGAAIEHAAEQHVELVKSETEWLVGDPPASKPSPISFKDIFLDAEKDDEENMGLSALLAMLRGKWPGAFKAADVASYLEPEFAPPTPEAREIRAVLERATGEVLRNVSPSAVSWRLKKLLGNPVIISDEILILIRDGNRRTGDAFRVERKSAAGAGR
jgi:hypothetical protein